MKNFWISKNQPQWWPDTVPFKSLYHPRDGSKLSIHDLRKVLVGFLSTDQYELVDKEQTVNDIAQVVEYEFLVCSMRKYDLCVAVWEAPNWVQCTKCLQWAHGRCLGLKPNLLPDEKFQCCESLSEDDNITLYKYHNFEITFIELWSLYRNHPLSSEVVDFHMRLWTDTIVRADSLQLMPSMLWTGVERALHIIHLIIRAWA
jgi:hypothetical protein